MWLGVVKIDPICCFHQVFQRRKDGRKKGGEEKKEGKKGGRSLKEREAGRGKRVGKNMPSCGFKHRVSASANSSPSIWPRFFKDFFCKENLKFNFAIRLPISS